MSKVTYQTRLPDSVQEFCDAMGGLFGQIERDLFKDLERGKKLKELKKSYQIKYQINSRQFNSIHIFLKGKIESRKECHSRQIKEVETRIKSLSKWINESKKKLKKLPSSCGLNSQKTEKSRGLVTKPLLKFSLHHKQRKLASAKDKLVGVNGCSPLLKKSTPSFIFGGKKLWSAQFNLEENGYENHEQWLNDWRSSKQLTELAGKYACPLVIESLDFSRKKATMKEQGIRYSRMLSNFSYSCFHSMLISRAVRFGIEVREVNPAYSSLIGLTKFMSLYGLSSDTAAALVIARRALRFSERIPTNYARLVQVDSSRHVWSFWNALNKKLKGRKRHSYFKSVANSEIEVKLLDESQDRSNGKSQDTSSARRDSLPRIPERANGSSPLLLCLGFLILSNCLFFKGCQDFSGIF